MIPIFKARGDSDEIMFYQHYIHTLPLVISALHFTFSKAKFPFSTLKPLGIMNSIIVSVNFLVTKFDHIVYEFCPYTEVNRTLIVVGGSFATTTIIFVILHYLASLRDLFETKNIPKSLKDE